MTIDITGNLFTHAVGSRITVASQDQNGGLRLRVKNGPQSINIDELSFADKVAFARWLLQDVSYGPEYTLDAFKQGTGGP